MKEKRVYICELCRTEYAKEQDAMDCEAYHLSPKKIIDKRYVNMRKDACRAQLEVSVEVVNGEKYIYRRMKN